MIAIIQICLVPLTLALMTLILPPRLIRLTNALGSWLQLGVVTVICSPLLFGSVATIAFTNDFVIDRLGGWFVLLTTFVVACATTHTNYFFDTEESAGVKIAPQRFRLFYICVNAFLLAMTFIFLCDNLGFLWVSLEATTLSSAPLVYFERTKHALEAAWKYIIICSVGIAFALLGTVFVFAAAQHGHNVPDSLSMTVLTQHASDLNFSFLRLGFIFITLGYGTKAGIFPLHSWLPDAHSEAVAPASAMLSGALLNCALYGIFRVSQIVFASGHVLLSANLLLFLGSVTVVAGSLFLIRQYSFKRMWAYSSIENVGLMLVAIGLNQPLLFLLQAINHSLAKVSLFLLSGNLIQKMGSKRLNDLRGIASKYPVWALLLSLGAMAITGVPPFGAFISEVLILVEGAQRQYWWVVGALVAAITICFIAVTYHLGKILTGTPKVKETGPIKLSSSFVPASLILISLCLGVFFNAQLWMTPK